MRLFHNLKSKKSTRKVLRNQATPQEIILWSRLCNSQLGFKFRRQHSFGKFVVDFYCPTAKLIIEIDGSEHISQEKYDCERTNYLSKLGYRVIRFWNNEINTNINGVIMKIVEELNNTTPPRGLGTPPQRGGVESIPFTQKPAEGGTLR